MLDVFNFPSPQSANYQEFYGGGTTRTWVKPRGASMVRFMLIGGGGGGSNGSTSVGGGGGGSGAVTSWIGPAMFIPDILRITVGAGGMSSINATDSTVIYQAKDGTGYTLLYASGGVSGTTSTITAGTGGAAMQNNPFTASGIFAAIAGQDGAAGSSLGQGGDITASTTTFLSGGAGGSGGSANTGGGVNVNFGYPALPPTDIGGTTAKDGYFISQPILLSVGGTGGSTTTSGVGSAGGRGGLGSGGGGSGEDAASGGRGGDGAVFVWAW